MKTITIESSFLLDQHYWEYKANVQIKFGEIWTTNIVWAKGVDYDDRPLELTETIEEIVKIKAEDLAKEQVLDPLSAYNEVGADDSDGQDDDTEPRCSRAN